MFYASKHCLFLPLYSLFFLHFIFPLFSPSSFSSFLRLLGCVWSLIFFYRFVTVCVCHGFHSSLFIQFRVRLFVKIILFTLPSCYYSQPKEKNFQQFNANVVEIEKGVTISVQEECWRNKWDETGKKWEEERERERNKTKQSQNKPKVLLSRSHLFSYSYSWKEKPKKKSKFP